MNHFTNIMANQSITSLISYMIIAVILFGWALHYDVPRYAKLLTKHYHDDLSAQRQAVIKEFALRNQKPNSDKTINEILTGRLARRINWILTWSFCAATQIAPHNNLTSFLMAFVALWLLGIYLRRISWPTAFDPDRPFKPVMVVIDVIVDITAYICLIWSFIGALGATIIVIHLL